MTIFFSHLISVNFYLRNIKLYTNRGIVTCGRVTTTSLICLLPLTIETMPINSPDSLITALPDVPPSIFFFSFDRKMSSVFVTLLSITSNPRPFMSIDIDRKFIE